MLPAGCANANNGDYIMVQNRQVISNTGTYYILQLIWGGKALWLHKSAVTHLKTFSVARWSHPSYCYLLTELFYGKSFALLPMNP